MYEKDLIYQIALTKVEGVGHITARTLLGYCGSAENAFTERKRVLERIPGIGARTATALKAFTDFRSAEQEIAFLERNNIRVFCYMDKSYPAKLKLVTDAPFLLYFKGNCDLNRARVVAVVGTRRSTGYGGEFTRQLVKDLAAYDCLVISGLAYGIDIIAHKAAVKNNLPTVGVLAHGLDMVYPPLHRPVAEEMLANGGLLTEYPSGTNPDKQHFPDRNRIVAGMCDVCVVVETAVKGGAMITAELANAYNRDVMALPGRIHDPVSAGCNYLIRTNKAHMIESVADLAYLMGWEQGQPGPRQRKLFTEVTEMEKAVLDRMPGAGKISVDDLFVGTQIPMSQLSLLLLDLEIKGLVKSLPGKAYELVS